VTLLIDRHQLLTVEERLSVFKDQIQVRSIGSEGKASFVKAPTFRFSEVLQSAGCEFDGDAPNEFVHDEIR
jgi:hypothetical protein